MTIRQTTTEFRAAASTKGDFRADSAEDHALHERTARAFRFLASQGSAECVAFVALLDD
jgi:hypothetical protein